MDALPPKLALPRQKVTVDRLCLTDEPQAVKMHGQKLEGCRIVRGHRARRFLRPGGAAVLWGSALLRMLQVGHLTPGTHSAGGQLALVR